MTNAIVSEVIIEAIVTVRGQRVIVASDLAALYGVPTDRLNEQVKRNAPRFPADICFRLTRAEQAEVSAKCGHLQRLKFAPIPPLAFTEHGVLMAASVLNSPLAHQASLHIVRAFVAMRNTIAAHADLARKLDELERRYDGQFRVVFEAIRELMTPPVTKKRPIGFR